MLQNRDDVSEEDLNRIGRSGYDCRIRRLIRDPNDILSRLEILFKAWRNKGVFNVDMWDIYDRVEKLIRDGYVGEATEVEALFYNIGTSAF